MALQDDDAGLESRWILRQPEQDLRHCLDRWNPAAHGDEQQTRQVRALLEVRL
jgi:hypothetical protein